MVPIQIFVHWAKPLGVGFRWLTLVSAPRSWSTSTSRSVAPKNG